MVAATDIPQIISGNMDYQLRLITLPEAHYAPASL